MSKVYTLLLKLFPIKIIFNKVKIVKIRNISDKTFLPIEEEILIHCGEVIGIVKHGQNNEHVNSKLDLFVYKVEKVENLQDIVSPMAYCLFYRKKITS
jgi:hypothetical protein